ncbi:IS21 family transposase [Magnetococcus marinus]|uniref:IS21 family transposase n=1 Tax=Magnetococcus marinus TaxID=1124597 RepID=UPI00135F1782|nr:IS21 family transposase [Magnetococcus marinus]
METRAKIRRDREVLKKSIKQISRDRHVSRNTVRKILEEEPGQEIGYQRSIQPRPQLGPYVERLEKILEADWPQPRKQRLQAKQIFETLAYEGYQGAYDSVRRYVKAWRTEKGRNPGTVFIPLYFEPGSAYQFDWSYESAVLGGVHQSIKVAHFRLAHSRMIFVVAFLRESLEMLLDAHNRAFKFFGGCPHQGIYDNLSTAVDKILKGKERTFNSRFEAMCDHFLVEPVACTPAAGWEKGQVEKQVRDVRNWFFKPIPQFADLEELNHWLADRCWGWASTHPHPEQKQRTVAAVFQQEREHLIRFSRPFDAYKERECRVSSTSLIQYDGNQYSVEAIAARKAVTIRAYAERIMVIHKGKVVADHLRNLSKG